MNLRNTSFYGVGLLTVMSVAACKAVPLTAPNEATMTIVANPASIAAVGGASTITATVFKAADDGGGTVADGTQIFFTSDLGVIEERVATTNGIARATLQSDGRAGQATVRASSGSLEAQEVMVEIGAGGAGDVITVVANPALLGPFDFTSEIVATVTDSRGNPIANVPMIFGTDAGTMASQGSVLRTNVNGQAADRLTFLDDGTTSATVTVSSGELNGEVTVSRAVFDAPIIDFVSPSSGMQGQTLPSATIGGQNFQPGATVSFGAGILINSVTFVNSETLTVSIFIDSLAEDGVRDVTVTNPDGQSGTFPDAFGVNITPPPPPPPNPPPTCAFTVAPLDPVTPGTGTSVDPFLLDSVFVAFDASASADDGTIVSYSWTFGDGGVGSGIAPGHDYTATTAPGDVLSVALQVTDDGGETCDLVRFVEVP